MNGSSPNIALLHARSKRIDDALNLRQPDRVPVVFFAHFYTARLTGNTFEEAMYDVDIYLDGLRKTLRELQPDTFSPNIFAFGQTLENLEYKPMLWPGHGVDPNATFQYLDDKFMEADEYDDYILDPTRFYLKKYLPRVAGKYKFLEKFPDFSASAEWDLIGAVSAFGDPEVQEGFKHLFEVGNQMLAVKQKVGGFVQEMENEGLPSIFGGFCKSPYDLFVDLLRGSKAGMIDMFRNKDKLLEAMEKASALLLENAIAQTKATGNRYVFIPLHWGLDGFMSEEQFKTFYWPQLRAVMMKLIEHDLVPCPLWEGNCSSRLEIIADIPAGKCIYGFEATDVIRAKEVLGGTVCVRGNVPASILNTGTADDVDAYCRNLIEKAGKDGGFILDGAVGIPDEAKPENVAAMFESVKKYNS